jgi:hypothetical protein
LFEKGKRIKKIFTRKPKIMAKNTLSFIDVIHLDRLKTKNGYS